MIKYVTRTDICQFLEVTKIKLIVYIAWTELSGSPHRSCSS